MTPSLMSVQSTASEDGTPSAPFGGAHMEKPLVEKPLVEKPLVDFEPWGPHWDSVFARAAEERYCREAEERDNYQYAMSNNPFLVAEEKGGSASKKDEVDTWFPANGFPLGGDDKER